MKGAHVTTPRSMLPEAASISRHYPQFNPVLIPGSDAEATWEGVIQPFANNDAARSFLRSMERNDQFIISEGRIISGNSPILDVHWADPFLTKMAEQCRVLVLAFKQPKHPRSYLLSPEFSRAFLSYHPHPRTDLEIHVGGRNLTGLCVYSAAEFAFSGQVAQIVEYLDQVTLFIARHLIWLRTRRLYQVTRSAKKLIYTPKPGELVVDNEVGIQNAAIASITIPERKFWDGYWPGPVARASGSNHLSLRPDRECWCGSGLRYDSCHRALEQSLYRQSANRFSLSRRGKSRPLPMPMT